MADFRWFDLGDGRQVFRKVPEPRAERSSLPCPMLIRDDMDPTEHPHDGKRYTSKAAFRRVTRENGYIEVGNDPQRFRTPNRTKPEGIRQSLQRAKARLG